MDERRRLVARLGHVRPFEVPFRLAALATRLADRRWRPPPTPAGPPPRWPWKGPPAPSPPAFAPDPADPRSVWEPWRLQHATADEALAFFAEHPLPSDAAWESAPEAALRLASIARIAAHEPRPELRSLAHACAAWVARHPSEGTSANNHRVAELAGLALAARVLPDLPEARGWGREALRLPDVLAAQVHPDGAGVEQSPTYLAYDLEWALVARAAGVDGLDAVLARAARFLAALLDEQGHVPALGDDDGGRVLAIRSGPEPGYVRSVAGAVSAALGLPAPDGWAPDARTLLLGQADAPGRETPPAASFPHGGLTVLRRGRAAVAFDHGPLGGAFLAAHGHADALAAYLTVERPLLVGRGTGTYLGDPSVRRFHRGTRAHPTVVVDGADQSVQHDHPFLWRTRARAWLEHVDLAAATATAAHDGYRRRGVLHRRTVTLHDDALVLDDLLDGQGRHHVAVVLPLPPDLDRLALDADPRTTVRAVRDRHSPAYGRWVDATTLLAEAHVRLPIRLRTVIRFG